MLVSKDEGGGRGARQGCLALDASVGNLANLARVELCPRATMELGVKGGDVLRRHEVDESVADVAPVAKVDR